MDALSRFLHTLATAVWIGGAIVIMSIVFPVLERTKELGPMAGRITTAMGRRFTTIVWVCIIIFFATGVPMTLNDPEFSEGSSWYTVIAVKHILVGIMVLAAAIQTITLRAMEKMMQEAASAPPAQGEGPPEPPALLMKLRKRLMAAAATVLVLGIVVLLLTAIAEAL